jgi:dihydrofolate synthase/folylpolyglutamate synthase
MNLLYEDAVKKLEELGNFRINPSLKNISQFLKEAGLKPAFKVFQISGTNGKTSTATFLAALFTSAGKSTGLYLSPHVYQFGERISLDGKSLSFEEFGEYFHQFFYSFGPLIEKHSLTQFEILTAMALWLFNKKGVEIGVFETGLGGRFDAVSALGAEVGVLTGVSLDHTDLLGKTVREIAFEKLLPFRKKTLYTLDRFLKSEIEWVAGDLKVKLKVFNSASLGINIDEKGTRIFSPFELNLKLIGKKFAENAFLALKTAADIGIAYNPQILTTVRLPGRFQKVDFEDSVCICDGSHNPEAIAVLLETFRKYNGEKEFAVVCGFMKDKDYETMLSLIKSADPLRVFLVPIKDASGRSANLYGHQGGIFVYEHDLETAVKKALSYTGTVLVTGSLYLCGNFIKTFSARLGLEKLGYNYDGSFSYYGVN